MQGHDSRVPSPTPSVGDINVTPVENPPPSPEYEPTSPAEEAEEDIAVHLVDNRNFTPADASEAPCRENLDKQHVFFVQGKSHKCLVMDSETHECFFLKLKTSEKE